MRTIVLLSLMLMPAILTAAETLVPLSSPGFPPSHLDAAGRLVEDWATVGVRLSGEGVSEAGCSVQAIRLDELIPAGQAVAERGCVRLVCTAYRAPVFPSGVDVYTVRLEEAQGQRGERCPGT